MNPHLKQKRSKLRKTRKGTKWLPRREVKRMDKTTIFRTQKKEMNSHRFG
jgi:hypothetical protein